MRLTVYPVFLQPKKFRFTVACMAGRISVGSVLGSRAAFGGSMRPKRPQVLKGCAKGSDDTKKPAFGAGGLSVKIVREGRQVLSPKGRIL